MTPDAIAAAYLRGEPVANIALKGGADGQKVSRAYVYRLLTLQGVELRIGRPRNRSALAQEILEDLDAPMTLSDLNEWLGETEQKTVSALLILIRDGKVALTRAKQTPLQAAASIEQRTLL